MKQPIEKLEIKNRDKRPEPLSGDVITLGDKINELIERVNELYDNRK